MTKPTRNCLRCERSFLPYGGRTVCATCRFEELDSPEYKAKAKIWQSVNKAIREGRLVRLPCEVCGAVKSDAHHDDYSKPLSVRWLCRPHHYAHHRQQRDAA